MCMQTQACSHSLICMHACMHACMYVRMVCMCVHVYVPFWKHMPVLMYDIEIVRNLCMHACMHADVCVCVCMYACRCVSTPWIGF